eukprot:CAMPEP_0181476632 /NCGR_PEP_ID=MMETSP1110-20121109/41806_1 /TAXON_ID=174948 /ORGANISM="Symbiodinium sp., Strain CCMP421" /LENGTH=323 /DNA_ID=CAMNT_0023601919 /DNA_START=668 /DNA_END=1639 /DNA_ORIENTATION=+
MAICSLLQGERLHKAGPDLGPLFTPHEALIWNNQASIQSVVNHNRDIQAAQEPLEVCGETEFLVTFPVGVETSPHREAKRLTCCDGHCGLCRILPAGQEWKASLPGLNCQGYIGLLIKATQLFNPWAIEPPLARPPARLHHQPEVARGPACELVRRHREDSGNVEFSVCLRAAVQQTFRRLAGVVEEAGVTVSFLGVVPSDLLQCCTYPITTSEGELKVRSGKPSEQDGEKAKQSEAGEALHDRLSRCQNLQELDPAEAFSTTRLVALPRLWPDEDAARIFGRVVHNNIFHAALDDVTPPGAVAMRQGASPLVYSNLPTLRGE